MIATIYVDNMKAYYPKHHRNFCQMWSSNIEALHQMARQLRVHPDFFQDHIEGFRYYDVPYVERKEAIDKGVIPVTIRELCTQVRLARSNTNDECESRR